MPENIFMDINSWVLANCRFAALPFHYRKQASSPLFAALWALRPQIAAAAQEVYDGWQQDDDGVDEVLGGGGICQDVAEAIAGVVSGAGIDATTQFDEYEHHVECIAYSDAEAFYVDIPYSLYETGGGYSWKKINGVNFSPDNVTFAPTEPPGENGYD
jgi:hypothetical protein